MQILDAEQTRQRLDYVALADAIAAMAARVHAGEAAAPERQVVTLANDGTLLVMPAADADMAMTKLVTVHPHNGELNLPTLAGEVLVMNADNGVRHGILDGATVSGRRTAALSLLAATRLAPDPDAPLLIVGAGTQARAHLEAFHAGLGTTRVCIVSRTRSRAEELADHAGELGMDARVLERVEDAPADTRLYVTATTSAQPVLPADLPEDAFVAAVGAFRPDMAELPSALIARAAVVVDTLAGAQAEAGDLIQAADAGAFAWQRARELPAVVAGTGETLDGPIVFKSVGHALWDLAAAKLAFTNQGK